MEIDYIGIERTPNPPCNNTPYIIVITFLCIILVIMAIIGISRSMT